MRVSLKDPSTPSLEAAAPAALATAAAPAADTASASGGPSFADVLHGLGRTIGEGEASMRAAVHAASAGGDLGPARLIALQAGVYRYSEAIDLSSRLVDRTTSGVKTVLQGSGQ